MQAEAKLTVGQAMAATKFLIIATDRNSGETVFCQQPSRLRRYRFAPTYTLKGAVSERRITREEATEFTFAEAQETLSAIDNNLRDAMDRWIDNWRIVPAQGEIA